MSSSPDPSAVNGSPRVLCRVPLPLSGRGGASAPDLVTFSGLGEDDEHVALVWGPVSDPPLVRIHSECLTGDVFGSARCDCGPQLGDAVEMLARQNGILLYLRQEGRGIGLYRKVEAYSLQDRGLDTVDANRELSLPADGRHYGAAARMLRSLGHDEVRLLTNNPAKVEGLESGGVRVVGRVPTRVFVGKHNHDYLETKRERMGHILPESELSLSDD